MKYSWHIVTILLAASLSVVCIGSLSQNDTTATTKQTDDKETILNSILTRSSVRSYNDQIVPDSIVEKILRVGMAAPTAGNRQPWEFYVVRDTNILKQFPTVTQFADPMAQHAKIAIVVCGVPSESFPIEPRYWVQDCSAATENILLAAHALGLGAVWCGVYPGEDRVATLAQLLKTPEKLTPFNIIFLGYPNTEATIKDKWKPQKIHYIK